MDACMSAPSGGHPLTVRCHTSSRAVSEANDCSLGLQRLNQHDPIKRMCSRARYSFRSLNWHHWQPGPS